MSVGSAGRSGAPPAGVGVQDPDAVLIERVRSGDREAYAALYERHGPAARRFARSLVTTDSDADDVVAEVFAGILSAMERGRGPMGTFAPYLMSSVRNECYRYNRRRRRESTDRYESVDGDTGRPPVHHDPYDRLDEVAILRTAFESLPVHQREVLWRTEVEEVSPTELADRSGSTPHAMAMTAMRARRALGSAYLDQHLVAEKANQHLDADCQDARPHLVGYVRGTLGMRRRRRIEAHLEGCAHCNEARDGLGRLNTHLRALPILPLDVGALGSATLGIKAQIVGWLSAQAVPIATSGVLAVSALGPVAAVPIPPHHRVAEAPVESSAVVTADVPSTTSGGSVGPEANRPAEGGSSAPAGSRGPAATVVPSPGAPAELPIAVTPATVDVPTTASTSSVLTPPMALARRPSPREERRRPRATRPHTRGDPHRPAFARTAPNPAFRGRRRQLRRRTTASATRRRRRQLQRRTTASVTRRRHPVR